MPIVAPEFMIVPPKFDDCAEADTNGNLLVNDELVAVVKFAPLPPPTTTLPCDVVCSMNDELFAGPPSLPPFNMLQPA
jgi:hypothetical protein